MTPPNLQEAREQFARAEAEADPTAKLETLEEALALVDELLEESAVAESDKAVARNVRRSYLRRLLQQLVQMTNVEILDWCGYVRLFVVDHRAEVQSLFEADPALKKAFDSFVALWNKEFKAAFGKSIDEL